MVLYYQDIKILWWCYIINISRLHDGVILSNQDCMMVLYYQHCMMVLYYQDIKIVWWCYIINIVWWCYIMGKTLNMNYQVIPGLSFQHCLCKITLLLCKEYLLIMSLVDRRYYELKIITIMLCQSCILIGSCSGRDCSD